MSKSKKNHKSTDWLRGVVAGPTHVADLTETDLFYRGYSITDLVSNYDFESVAYLLINGSRPHNDDLILFRKSMYNQRRLPWRVSHLCEVLITRHNMPPIDVLSTLIGVLKSHSLLGSATDSEANRAKALQLLAQMPTLMGMIAHHAGLWKNADDHCIDIATKYFVHIYDLRENEIRSGTQIKTDSDGPGWPISPNLTLPGYVYYMATGRMPDPESTAILDVILTLYAEHGFAASTFASRVVASTDSDFHSAIIAGLSALKGPLHGGASERTAKMLQDDLRANTDIEKYVTEERFFSGFGHPVYKECADPRVKLMDLTIQKYASYLQSQSHEHWGPHAPDWIAVASRLREAINRKFSGRIKVNVEFPIALALTMLGVNRQLYPMIFAIARTSGWAAHIIEHQTPVRTPIIRPLARYEK